MLMTPLLELTQYLFTATILFDTAVLAFVLWHRVSKAHRTFVVVLGITITWEVLLWLNFFWRADVAMKTVLNHVVFALGPVVLYSVIIFLEHFNHQPLLAKFLHRLLAVFVAVLSSLCLLGLVSTTIQYYGPQPYQFFTSTTPLLQVYYLSFIPLLVVIFYQIITIYRQLTGYRKQQAKYILIGLLTSCVLATAANVWFPMFHTFSPNAGIDDAIQMNTLVQIYGGMACSIWTLLTAYALTRYRLFDVTVKIKRSLVLAGCVVGLGLVMYGLDRFLFTPYLDGTQQSLALALSAAGALSVMVWCTRTIGLGDPISLVLAEPIHSDTTVQQLVEKLQHYIAEEFALQSNGTYVLDIVSKQYAHSQTGVVVKVSSQVLNILQTGVMVNQDIPHSLKPAKGIVPLIYNDVLIGFVTILQATVDTALPRNDLVKHLQPFAGLLYQVLFARYVKISAVA